MWKMQISERIKNRRRQLGLSQEELGERMGVGKSCVCRLETENINMTIERIERIANALEISPITLVGWDEIGTDAGSDLAVSATDSIHVEEQKSLDSMFFSLNEQGRQKLLEYAKDLGRIEMYRD